VGKKKKKGEKHEKKWTEPPLQLQKNRWVTRTYRKQGERGERMPKPGTHGWKKYQRAKKRKRGGLEGWRGGT